ncbi:MAG: alanine dehydrogenase [Desulfobacteraceae bacterium]|jgi:alanine dehydrogenase
MIIGITKEIKTDENRVAVTPAGVEILQHNGHDVLVETAAGRASGFPDADYSRSGAQIVDSAASIFQRAEMILRVKEPQPSEFQLLRKDQIYFSYLHLATSKALARALIETGGINIAYETIQKADGMLPLLKPMSQVAGAMAIQEGAKYLEMAQQGHGVLLGGVPGVDTGSVLVIGAGMVGGTAAKVAAGLGANVYALDVDLDRMRYLDDIMPSNCYTVMSSPAAIRELLPKADLVIGSVLVPGSRTPIMVTREMLGTMKKGAVLVDVAIDQGGCFESSEETTHARPTYTVDGIVHYAVSNMPGALPRTATIALTNATLPYVLEIAGNGWKKAMQANPEIKAGANIVDGKVTYKGVADACDLTYTPIDQLL